MIDGLHNPDQFIERVRPNQVALDGDPLIDNGQAGLAEPLNPGANININELVRN